MSQADDLCEPGDNLCTVKTYEQEVIIVPCLLIGGFLLGLLVVCLLRYCRQRRPAQVTVAAAARPHRSRHGHTQRHTQRDTQRETQRDTHRHTQRQTQRHHQRHDLQGIDAPPELNALEHEVLPMTAPSRPTVPQPPSERQHSSLQLVTPLPLSFSVKPGASVALYRARMEHRDVVLRVLKESADASERQHFLGFASFLSELGPHPFLPGLMGVVSVQLPLVMVVEELEHRDLLGYLWKCRQDHPGEDSPCDLTEKRLFTMGGQVASALEHLHSRSCIHGNVGARSVLVGRDLTAKLWGLGPAYRRRSQAGTPGELEDMEMRKWHAPELLARRVVNQSGDIWSFGILLHEMVTLGDPPFPEVMSSELLQYLQRGRTLRKAACCSSSLYSLIKSCCQWTPQQRPSLAELIQKLQSGERSANDRIVLRVPEPLNIERYLLEAGYGEAYNYAVL